MIVKNAISLNVHATRLSLPSTVTSWAKLSLGSHVLKCLLQKVSILFALFTSLYRVCRPDIHIRVTSVSLCRIWAWEQEACRAMSQTCRPLLATAHRSTSLGEWVREGELDSHTTVTAPFFKILTLWVRFRNWASNNNVSVLSDSPGLKLFFF